MYLKGRPAPSRRGWSLQVTGLTWCFQQQSAAVLSCGLACHLLNQAQARLHLRDRLASQGPFFTPSTQTKVLVLQPVFICGLRGFPLPAEMRFKFLSTLCDVLSALPSLSLLLRR